MNAYRAWHENAPGRLQSGLLYQEQIISLAAHNEPGNMEEVNHPFMCAWEKYAAKRNRGLQGL
jgi:hypothetical protein